MRGEGESVLHRGRISSHQIGDIIMVRQANRWIFRAFPLPWMWRGRAGVLSTLGELVLTWGCWARWSCSWWRPQRGALDELSHILLEIYYHVEVSCYIVGDQVTIQQAVNHDGLVRTDPFRHVSGHVKTGVFEKRNNKSYSLPSLLYAIFIHFIYIIITSSAVEISHPMLWKFLITSMTSELPSFSGQDSTLHASNSCTCSTIWVSF